VVNGTKTGFVGCLGRGGRDSAAPRFRSGACLAPDVLVRLHGAHPPRRCLQKWPFGERRPTSQFTASERKIALVVFASAVLAAGAASAQGQSGASTADRVPSILDMMLVFFGFLKGISLWYSIPMMASLFYGLIYGFYLRRAASHDLRNRGQQETTHYTNVIFWERIANYDLFALIYAICVPLMPILFLLAVLNTLKR